MKVLSIRVKPNSRQQMLRWEEDGSLTVQLKSPPVDGKANRELVELLAKELDVSKSRIQIKSGATSRNKRVEIEDL
jgi:uncharacterized protein (TIGR00251 family)